MSLKINKVLILSLISMGLHQPSSCMDEITAEEWEAIRKSEEAERQLQVQEEQEFEEALRLSTLDAEQLRIEEQQKQIKKEKQARAAFRLPPLTDTQMAAGYGHGESILSFASMEQRIPNRYYNVQDSEFKELHRQGHVASTKFLESIFMRSIFQYNIAEITGFDIMQNYAQYEQSTLRFGRYEHQIFEPLAKILGYTVPFSMHDIQPAMFKDIELLKNAFEMFKQNKLLQQLGAAYMRQKIVVEKIQQEMDHLDATAKERVQPILLKHDRFAIDLQTMIYAFMKEACMAYIDQLKTRAPYPGDYLITYVPSFVHYPYYANIIDQLGKLMAPTT